MTTIKAKTGDLVRCRFFDGEVEVSDFSVDAGAADRYYRVRKALVDLLDEPDDELARDKAWHVLKTTSEVLDGSR